MIDKARECRPVTVLYRQFLSQNFSGRSASLVLAAVRSRATTSGLYSWHTAMPAYGALHAPAAHFFSAL